MNSRERIFAALENREPDVVPIAPYIGWYSSVVLGLDLDDLSRMSMLEQKIPAKGYIPRWKSDLEAYRRLGMDAILFAQCSAAKNTTRESFKVNRHPRGILIHKTYDTPKGPLTEELVSLAGKVGVDNRKYMIDDPEDDLEKVEYVLGDPTRIDFMEYEQARYQVGDEGIVAVRCNSPMAFWLTMRGMQEGLLDFWRRRPTVDKYMKMYGKWIIDYISACGDYQVDLIFFRGTYDGYTIISPEDWKRYIGEPLTRASREAGVKIQYFLEGKCAKLLGLVRDTGVNCLGPIEPPPQGDCDLAKAKSEIGRDVCLRGNITPFELELASTDKVEKIVMDNIKAGAHSGGYILSTTDQITLQTPVDNAIALVRAAKKYGKYPIMTQ
jgi:hypothetical protein